MASPGSLETVSCSCKSDDATVAQTRGCKIRVKLPADARRNQGHPVAAALLPGGSHKPVEQKFVQRGEGCPGDWPGGVGGGDHVDEGLARACAYREGV